MYWLIIVVLSFAVLGEATLTLEECKKVCFMYESFVVCEELPLFAYELKAECKALMKEEHNKRNLLQKCKDLCDYHYAYNTPINEDCDCDKGTLQESHWGPYCEVKEFFLKWCKKENYKGQTFFVKDAELAETCYPLLKAFVESS